MTNRSTQSIQKYLDRGEIVIWSDQPIPSSYAIVGYKHRLIFFIPWTVIALSQMHTEWTKTQSVFSTGFFVISLFAILGIGMLISPIFQYRKAAKVSYAITDKRAIIDRNGNMRSFPHSGITFVDIDGVDSTGKGHVLFTTAPAGEGDVTKDGFWAVREAPKIQQILLRQLETSQKASKPNG